MLTLELFPGAGLRLVDLVLTPRLAVALLVATAPTAVCPRCGTPSDRVHARYRRTVADLPGQGHAVALRLLVRKFRCSWPDCPQAIFCERFPDWLQPHARPTDRLTVAHQDLGFALGSEAGARLAEKLDMPTSPDTLLRRVKGHVSEPTEPVRHVGVDDWAIRKGQRYGTILVDLQRGRLIDLLPGRNGEALKAWLKAHPEVEVISRDRWAAYAQAANEAAPQARPAKREQRAERHRRVHELRGQGVPIRQIARQVGLNVKAVRRYLRQEHCPDWNPGRQPPTQLDSVAPIVDAWVARGGRNAAELHRELAGQGCRAGYDSVRRFLRRRLGSTGRPGPRTNVVVPPAPPPPSARKLSFEFIRRVEDRKEEEQVRLDRLRAAPVLQEGLALATEFAEMVRKESERPVAEWLDRAAQCVAAELRGFAEGLRQDEAAVGAALTEPWSNGPVEGQVNRLKVIKRQMYGRAGLQLLRARVLYAA